LNLIKKKSFVRGTCLLAYWLFLESIPFKMSDERLKGALELCEEAQQLANDGKYRDACDTYMQGIFMGQKLVQRLQEKNGDNFGLRVESPRIDSRNLNVINPLESSTSPLIIRVHDEIVRGSFGMEHFPRILPIHSIGSESTHSTLVVVFGQEIGRLFTVANIKGEGLPATLFIAQCHDLAFLFTKWIDLVDKSERFHLFTADPGIPRSSSSSTIHRGTAQYHLVVNDIAILVKGNGTNAALALRFYFRVAGVDPTSDIVWRFVWKGRAKAGPEMKIGFRFISIVIFLS
jgi:hypothetical protein